MKTLLKQSISIMLSVLILVTSLFVLSADVFAASSFTSWTAERNYFPTSEKSTNYKYYYTDINPYVSNGYGLPNCTCFAYARAYEVLKSRPKFPVADASYWYDYNKKYKNYRYGNLPLAGAIACWSGGSSGSGHVAFVEKVNGSTITISESAWSWRNDSSRDDMHVITMEDYQLNNYYGTDYVFQGFIYLFDGAVPENQEIWVMDYNVNVRSSYSTKATCIDTYYKGTTIKISEYKSNDGYFWGRVGENAWCVLDYCHYESGTNQSGYYGVSYNLNGGEYNGTDYMTGTLKKKNRAVTVTKNKPVRSGYNFLGWSSKPAATSVEYKSGSQYTVNNSVTLYAVWQKIFNISEAAVSLDINKTSSKVLSYKINTSKAYKINFSRSDSNVAKCTFLPANNQLVIQALNPGKCTVSIGLLDVRTNKYLDIRSFNVTVTNSGNVLATNSLYNAVSITNVTQNAAKVEVKLRKAYTITEYGIEYGTSKSALKVSKSVKTQRKDSLSASWSSGLKTGTTYYVRFYLICNGKKYISPFQQFKTLSNVTSLAIKKLPKTTYTIGDKLNDSSMLILATYKNGRTEYLTSASGWKISGFTTKSAGEKTVTVSYGGVSTTYKITVNCPVPSKSVITEIRNTTTGIKTTWKALSNANGYRVYRKEKGAASWTKLKDVTTNYYNDRTASNGKIYYYAVKGYYTSNGQTKWGALSSAKCFMGLQDPVVSLYSREYNSIKIKWTKNQNASGYYVYRKLSTDKSYTRIATIKDPSTTVYTDKNVSCGKTYIYAVRAYQSNYISSYISYSVKCTPGTPKLTSVRTSPRKINVVYNKVSGATAYAVYLKADGEKNYTRKGTATGTTYTIGSLKKGVKYTVCVRAYRRVGKTNVYGSCSQAKSIVCI